MQEGLQFGTNKHGAASPLESTAKRGRLDVAEYQYQSSELVPQPTGFHTSTVSTINSLPSMASTEYFSLPINDPLLYPMNDPRDLGCSNMTSLWDPAGWGEAITNTDLCFNELATMNQGIGMARDLTPVDSSHIYAQTLSYQPALGDSKSYQLSLGDSKPADFLAIRKTQGK